MVALLSATGAQTETIAPSIVLITIGSVTGVSINALFTGGLMPGLVLGVTLCALIWWWSRRQLLDGAPRPDRRTILRSLAIAAPALVLPIVIRMAMVEGVATATEVSTVGDGQKECFVCFRFGGPTPCSLLGRIEAGIEHRILDTIQGHSSRNVAEGYGEVTVKTQAAAIAKLPRYKIVF